MPPAFEVLLLNTAVPQIQAAQSGDTYVVPRDIAFSAALTLSAGTANGVPYLNASKVLTTGSALQFDGGNLGLGVAPSAWGASARVLELPNSTFFLNYSNNSQAIVGANAYYTGSNWLYKNTAAASNYEQLSGSHAWYTAPSGTAGNAITFTQAMTLDASGNLGIGTSSPDSGFQLTAYADVAGAIRVRGGGTGSNTARTASLSLLSSGNEEWIVRGANDSLRFLQSSTERARITSGGYFKASNTGAYVSSTGTYHEMRSSTANDVTTYFSHTDASNPFGIYIAYANAAPNGTGNAFLTCQDSTPAVRAEIRSNGGLANYSANNVNLASDERLKKDISPLGSTWSKVKAIEVVNFRYKDCNEGDPALFGVIAQQVQPIVPELVVVTQEAKEAIEATDAVLDADGNIVEPAVSAKEATPEYYGIREQPMYWLAIKALQEAMARIETLEAEVAALKGN